MARYWAGFLFADGTIVRRTGSPEVAVVLAEKDVAHVEKLRSFLGSDPAITRIRKEQQRGNFGGASGTVRFSVRSERLVGRLEHAGMVANQGRVACVELAHSADFWRGVVDGDGWVGRGFHRRRR